MPAELHPDRGELSRFVAGTLTAADNRRVVCHLLAGCEECRRLAAEIWQPQRVGISTEAVDRVLGQLEAREASIDRERSEAAALLAELEEHTPSRRLLLVLNSRRYCNWFLCERLVEQAFEAGFSDPDRAVELAELAVSIGDRLAGLENAAAVVNDLAGRAWSILANARRIRSDLAAAQEAFARALEYLERGSGDPFEEADLHWLRGLLYLEQRRFDDALGVFDAAMRLCRLGGDAHREGRILADKARTLGEMGRPQVMIRLLRRALGLLDPQREPRMVLVVQHNLTWALNESGRLNEALSLLHEILPLHARSAKAMDLLRLRWLEGKLAQAQGELERAEAAFREVHDGFLAREVPYDAAQAALDLAAVFYQQDRIGEMKRLAAEGLPVFRSLGVHRETLTALALFEEAVRRERISLRWIGELASYLQKARRNPKLPFQPPATPAPPVGGPA